MPLMPDMVVFSHLRWDFVYQRPQHLLSRLAAWQRIVFIEEPVAYDGDPRWELSQPASNVLVCRPLIPAAEAGFHADLLPTLSPMVHDLLGNVGVEEHIAWLYTPMALPLARELAPQLVVYDCMDELSAFLHAPPELLANEAALLRWADLVFTGGPSLYRAKRDRHPAVHCFPSSVDAPHFRQARRKGVEADDQSLLTRPRLGFYGVIDERVDLGILDALARARPEWQIVMVGPVVKIDPNALPQHPNIHYMGQRSYAQLPSYLAGWDVCLLPFARNESTRYISPTKTLEYMAAERMIVSTSIADVAEPYGDIVYLGDTPEQFIAACDRAMHADAPDRASRVAHMRAVLAKTSWDTTAEAMQRLITVELSQETGQQAA